ncbi:MAG: T9SS type A sorting domain-containing protein, partial [Lewinella sp.]|nr:T9SS type A sorting domain-containing protein [Lewinella sp.]
NASRELHPDTGDGPLENYIYQYWEEEEWNNGVREVSLVTPGMMGSIVSQWDTLTANWVPQFRYQTMLQENGLISEEVDRQYWHAEQETWLNEPSTIRRLFYWSMLTTGVQAPPQLPQACWSPNPYRAGMTISCLDLPVTGTYEVSLIDLMGRIVLTRSIAGASSFQIDQVPPAGTYVLCVRRGSELQHVQQLVIQP